MGLSVGPDALKGSDDMNTAFQTDNDACPGCGCIPGDGITETCYHPHGCGFARVQATSSTRVDEYTECDHCDGMIAEDEMCTCIGSKLAEAGLTAYINVTHYDPTCDSILTTTFDAPANWVGDGCIRLVNTHPGRKDSANINGRIVLTKYQVADALDIPHRRIASVNYVEVKSR